MQKKTNLPRAILKTRKLKATSTRIALLQLLQDFETAIPFSKIQETFNQTDRITLYRTIQVFLDKGIIHKAQTDRNGTYYALCGSNCRDKAHTHNHVHFECTSCHAVTCENLNRDIAIALPNFKIEKVHISLTGVCEKCNQ